MIAVKAGLALAEEGREVEPIVEEECPVMLARTRKELEKANLLNLLLLILLILILIYEVYRKVRKNGGSR
jgi:predicted nucleic acid-binding Zn ribbon protein